MGINKAKELCIEVFVYGKVGNDWVMWFKDGNSNGNSIIRTNFIKRDNYTTILLHNKGTNFNNLKDKARTYNGTNWMNYNELNNGPDSYRILNKICIPCDEGMYNQETINNLVMSFEEENVTKNGNDYYIKFPLTFIKIFVNDTEVYNYREIPDKLKKIGDRYYLFNIRDNSYNLPKEQIINNARIEIDNNPYEGNIFLSYNFCINKSIAQLK